MASSKFLSSMIGTVETLLMLFYLLYIIFNECLYYIIYLRFNIRSDDDDDFLDEIISFWG